MLFELSVGERGEDLQEEPLGKETVHKLFDSEDETSVSGLLFIIAPRRAQHIVVENRIIGMHVALVPRKISDKPVGMENNGIFTRVFKLV